MSLTLWLQYVVLEILLSLCPGPAVFTVIAQGIKHGGRKSIFGNLGICTGNGIYFLLSALGLGAMIAARPAIYLSLRWGGIAYLLYTAVRLLLAHAESASGILSINSDRLNLNRLSSQPSIITGNSVRDFPK